MQFCGWRMCMHTGWRPSRLPSLVLLERSLPPPGPWQPVRAVQTALCPARTEHLLIGDRDEDLLRAHWSDTSALSGLSLTGARTVDGRHQGILPGLSVGLPLGAEQALPGLPSVRIVCLAYVCLAAWPRTSRSCLGPSSVAATGFQTQFIVP